MTRKSLNNTGVAVESPGSQRVERIFPKMSAGVGGDERSIDTVAEISVFVRQTRVRDDMRDC